MERNTRGFSAKQAQRDRGFGTSGSGRSGPFAMFNPASTKVNRSLRAAEFDQFSRSIHRDLNPKGPLEKLVTRQAVRSAWRLQANLDIEEEIATPLEDLASIAADKAARALETAITTLDLLQGRRDEVTPASALPDQVDDASELSNDRCANHDWIESNEWPIMPIAAAPTADGDEAPIWRDRLVYDFDVSDHSPVVKGTWITVSRVVSLIVDGATWADVLRSHPELTEADIRTCVAYAVAEDSSAI